jgi:hypothetical protein
MILLFGDGKIKKLVPEEKKTYFCTPKKVTAHGPRAMETANRQRITIDY